MADPSKFTIYDLTRDVPSGITLSGLSVPKFDGVNYLRQPNGKRSTLTFHANKPGFAQLEYQLFEPASAITGLVKLDGKEISSQTFLAGKFMTNAVTGSFIQSGKHTFEIEYRCQPACNTPPNQYWTKLTVVDRTLPQATQQVGLKIIRLNQYAPNSRLHLSGTGNLRFDGVNFYRPVESSGIALSWPKDLKPFEVSFQLLGNQNFKVIARDEQQILAIATGNARKDVFLHVNLRDKEGIDRLSIEVKCLDKPVTPCTNLYFPSIIARMTSLDWANSLPLSLGFSFLILFALAWLLFPKHQPA